MASSTTSTSMNGDSFTTPHVSGVVKPGAAGLRSRRGLFDVTASSNQLQQQRPGGLKKPGGADGGGNGGLKKPAGAGQLRLREVCAQQQGPPSKHRQQQKQPLKKQRIMQGGGGLAPRGVATPVSRPAAAASGIGGTKKMRVFTDQRAVFARPRRSMTVAPVRSSTPASAVDKSNPLASSSDDMDLTDNETPNATKLRKTQTQRFTSPRAKSPSLVATAQNKQVFKQTRIMWERRQSSGDGEVDAAAPLVTNIVAPSLSAFDVFENRENKKDAGPGGLVAAPRTITAINKTKSITARYTSAIQQTPAGGIKNNKRSPVVAGPPSGAVRAASSRLNGSARRSLRDGRADRVTTRVNALNSRALNSKSQHRRASTRFTGKSRFATARLGARTPGSRALHRRRASQVSIRSDCSDDLLQPEFVYPLPGSDAEKSLKQAIQDASVYDGFDKEEIETLTQLKRMFSEIVAPSLRSFDIPEEELERLLTDYSTTSTATTWSTRTGDTHDTHGSEDPEGSNGIVRQRVIDLMEATRPPVYEDSDDEYEVPEHQYLTGLTDNVDIEIVAAVGGETPASVATE